jgi:hypothetical protein
MANPDDDNPSLYSGFTSPTVRITRASPDQVPETVPYSFGEPKTKLFRRMDAGADVAEEQTDDGPYVGCLVVVAGKARGRAFGLRYGRNCIGRDVGEHVRLNFGDEEISRNQHACVLHDPVNGDYYVEPGKSTPNLTYLERDGQMKPVLTATLLNDGDRIRVGGTTLMLSPFRFNWRQNES